MTMDEFLSEVRRTNPGFRQRLSVSEAKESLELMLELLLEDGAYIPTANNSSAVARGLAVLICKIDDYSVSQPATKVLLN